MLTYRSTCGCIAPRSVHPVAAHQLTTQKCLSMTRAYDQPRRSSKPFIAASPQRSKSAQSNQKDLNQRRDKRRTIGVRMGNKHSIYAPQAELWKPFNRSGLEAFADVDNDSPERTAAAMSAIYITSQTPERSPLTSSLRRFLGLAAHRMYSAKS